MDKVAKWLWEISKVSIDIHADNEYAFRLSCGYGNIEVAKWLWEISNKSIDIHAENEYAFIWSCVNGHLDVAKWLWEISNCSIKFHKIKPQLKRHFIYKFKNIKFNIHIKHYYYKPYDGPGYLKAINF
jgi:hypothetical protein